MEQASLSTRAGEVIASYQSICVKQVIRCSQAVYRLAVDP